MGKAVSRIERAGATVSTNVLLTSMEDLVLDGDDALEQLWSME